MESVIIEAYGQFSLMVFKNFVALMLNHIQFYLKLRLFVNKRDILTREKL